MVLNIFRWEDNTNEKNRFALIGCGRIYYKHINVINAVENAELVVTCDFKK